MRWALLLGMVLASACLVHGFEDQVLEDDDFAEFEQFDVDDEPAIIKKTAEEKEVPAQKPKAKDQFESPTEQEDEIMVEDEDNEFEHFHDPEEFEGFQDTTPRTAEQPKITISKVPIMVRPRWDAYWLEGILCCLLASYALAYVVGRAKNTSIATNFLKLHKPLLDDNFTLVGETGSDIVVGEDSTRGWRREAEHCFTMWCSGRLCCEGMLLTLKLIKRQDLVHQLIGVVRPSPDTLLARIELDKEGDPFVLCVAQKKIATRLSKEMQDLSVFCPERRPGDKHGLPTTLSVMSESAEATSAILDSRVTQALTQYHQYIQYIHISDRYSGPKQMEETQSTKPPENERVMLVSVALSGEGGGGEVRPLLQLIFHLLDKIKRTRLSKEALAKCEKRRQVAMAAWERVAHAARQEQAAAKREERRKQEKERILAALAKCEKRRQVAMAAWERVAHAARQEQAAAKREERRKQEKERILAEDDPEKQRRWELKEQKRQQKRKTPKMKQLKVKAL